jgi:hypothetical protein
LRFDGRCDGSNGEPSVGRSVDSRSRSLSTSSDGYTDRTDRYRETPTRGRDRPVRFVERFVERFDGRTTRRIGNPPVDRYPSSIRSRPPRRYEQRYLLSLTKSVSHSVGAFGPTRAESSVGRSVGHAKRGSGVCTRRTRRRRDWRGTRASRRTVARTRTRITENEEVV